MKTLQARGMPKSAQAGFTIIELIVVILLLGILTATALPRFLDVTDEAHAAVVDAVRSGLQTGAALFRAAYIANGEDAVDVSQFGDGTLDANGAGLGYPIGTDGGAAINDSADCLAVFNGLLQAGRPPAASATFSSTAATLETNIEGAASATTDFVVTTATEPAGGPPTTSTGCNFYYVGQFKEGTSSANVDLPLITYTVATGAIEQGTALTLDQD